MVPNGIREIKTGEESRERQDESNPRRLASNTAAVNAHHGPLRPFLGRQERIIKMKASFIKPRRELRPYIDSFRVCESETGMPLEERNLAVPNGGAKLLIPYENSLFGACEGRSGVSRDS